MFEKVDNVGDVFIQFTISTPRGQVILRTSWNPLLVERCPIDPAAAAQAALVRGGVQLAAAGFASLFG